MFLCVKKKQLVKYCYWTFKTLKFNPKFCYGTPGSRITHAVVRVNCQGLKFSQTQHFSEYDLKLQSQCCGAALIQVGDCKKYILKPRSYS